MVSIFFSSPLTWGDDPIWRAYFSDGWLKPPTRTSFFWMVGACHVTPFVGGIKAHGLNNSSGAAKMTRSEEMEGNHVFSGEMSHVEKKGYPGCLRYTYRGWTPTPGFFLGLFHKVHEIRISIKQAVFQWSVTDWWVGLSSLLEWERNYFFGGGIKVDA